jgi:hypothetical protein
MARVAASVLTLIVLSALDAPLDVRRALAADEPPSRLVVVADRDDDDLDGVPDGDQRMLPRAARVDLVPIPASLYGAILSPKSGAEHARVVVGDTPLAWGRPVVPGALLQGISAGITELDVRRGRGISALTVSVVGIGFRDGDGRDVDATISHASLDRSPPVELEGDASSHYAAPDPLRVVVATNDDAPPTLELESVTETGAHLDALIAPALSAVPCTPRDAPLHCFASEPIRFVIDDVDRRHALASGRSIRAELGGAIVVREGGKKAQAIRVLGPRSGPIGPIGRYRARLRSFVVRLTPGGAPAIGGSDSGAVVTMRAELGAAAAAWGECGVSFGPASEIAVRVVDPPPPHLLALGDEMGLPASGGRLRFRIDGKKPIEVAVRAGELPLSVARRVATAVSAAGYVAVVSPNARVSAGASASVDVSVRKSGGVLAALSPIDPGAPLSDDRTLVARLGSVDLEDGLSHFGDMDAVAGTIEERTLLKAWDDGDPSAIRVVVVPMFGGAGRIGESFIGTEEGSLRNIVILDRAGIRARKTSLTLAHELGHILLDVPGHPDDYGVDTPTRLMDADASDASPFGPRRITLAECARAIEQSGPRGRVPLLEPWPITRLEYPPTGAR